MKISRILPLSLFIIPLIGSIIFEPLIALESMRLAKESFVVLTIIAISILVYQNGHTEKVKPNYLIYGLVALCVYSSFHTPPIHLKFGAGDLGNSWVWQGLLWVLLYFVFYLSMMKVDINKSFKKIIVLSIFMSALITSFYAILQTFGFDQWQFVKPFEEIGRPTAKHITAMIGNPSYLGIWLCMCLPFIWLHIKKMWSIPIIFVIISTKSDFAIAGLVFYAILAWFLGAKKREKKFIGFLCVILVIGALWGIKTGKLENNSRLSLWSQTLKDWRGPCIVLPSRAETGEGKSSSEEIRNRSLNQRNYSLTGRGLGSFPFFYGNAHNSKWENPHNEPLAVAYSLGLFGLILYGSIIIKLLIETYPRTKDKFHIASYTSFVFICFASLGHPILHVEPLRFYTAIIFIFLSMISNEIKKSIDK